MSGRGHKSHGRGRGGAPGVNPAFVASRRDVGATAAKRARVGAPHPGMVLFKNVWYWCKKCGGSKSGKDDHSRLGMNPPDPEHANCKFFNSIQYLSAEKIKTDRLCETISSGGSASATGGVPPGPGLAAAPGGGAPRASAGAGSNEVRRAEARCFLAGHKVVIDVKDDLIKDVEGKAHSDGLLRQAVITDQDRAAAVDACRAANPMFEKLLARRSKVPEHLAAQISEARERQVSGRLPSLRFVSKSAPTTTSVSFISDGSVQAPPVTMVAKPDVTARLAAGVTCYLIDLDTCKAFQPPGGLMCPSCESTDLKVVQMTHTMSGRVGLVPVAHADGSLSWVSGKVRKCNACDATMKDYDGPMLSQMSEVVLATLPYEPSQAFGKMFLATDLEQELVANTVHSQGGGTIETTHKVYGARAHDAAGVAHDAQGRAWLQSMHDNVGDHVWVSYPESMREPLAKVREEYLLARDALASNRSPYDPWPAYEDVCVKLSDDVLRTRREISFETRRGTQRRSILSVGARARASNDNTFHAAAKMGFHALNVTSTETKEIATLKMLESYGAFAEYKDVLEQFFARDNVDVDAVHTDDAPNNKVAIERMAEAPLRGDKLHWMRRSTATLNNYGPLYSMACYRIKLSFSTPRQTAIALVDTLLLDGHIHVAPASMRRPALPAGHPATRRSHWAARRAWAAARATTNSRSRRSTTRSG